MPTALAALGAPLEIALETVERPLDAVEAALDAAPAGGGQVDEQSQIFDPRASLGLERGLEALEPADGLRREAAQLREVAGHGEHLAAHALVERLGDAGRKRLLDLRGLGRERREALARPLECDGQIGVERLSGLVLDKPDPGALEDVGIHWT